MNNSIGIVVCLILLLVVLWIYSTNFDIFSGGQVSSDTRQGIFSKLFNAIPYGGYLNRFNKLNTLNEKDTDTNDINGNTIDNINDKTVSEDISEFSDRYLLKWLHSKLITIYQGYQGSNKISADIDARIRQMSLFVSFDKTYTFNKTEIHIVLHNNISGRYFDKNTLLLIGIHEMTHIVNINKHHDSEFKRIEKEFIHIAEQLRYLNSTTIDPNYPCTR
jgi:hypothetical protein